jgi:toxin FitB
MFVLDTNVISELRKAKAGRANQGLTEWASDTSAPLMFMSAITLHELEHGVLLAEHNDGATGEILRTWLDDSVIPAFSRRILPVDHSVATTAAALHIPDPAPFRDALIAATAIVNHMSVVTRNVRDFERFTDVDLLNPWT